MWAKKQLLFEECLIFLCKFGCVGGITMIICEMPETGNRPGRLKRDEGLKFAVFTFTNFRTSTTVNYGANLTTIGT